MAIDIDTTVPTAAGDLRAVIRVPDADGPLPGMVLVDGSGDGDRHGWGHWPEWIGDAGAVVLRHDKPGCGGSPGDWTEQTLHDRANETLAAVEVLRRHPAVTGRPIGLYGASQGGWVSLLAAATGGGAVDFIVTRSGPGVSPLAQERHRIAGDLHDGDYRDEDIAEAMAWVDERAERLGTGDSPEAVLAEQREYAGRHWYRPVTAHAYDSVQALAFVGRNIGFDPATVLPRVSCPVLAMFGGADSMVPIADSVTAFATGLPRSPGGQHGLAVFPGADHGLYVNDPDTGRKLAPGVLPMLHEFLARRHRPTT